MDAADIKKLLDDTRKQEDEIRKDREALERVARLLKLPAYSNGRSPEVRELPFKSTRAKTLSSAIREAISAQVGQFTIHNILEFLEEKYPDKKAKGRIPSVSSILGQSKGKHLNVISSGNGTANVYEKI